MAKRTLMWCCATRAAASPYAEPNKDHTVHRRSATSRTLAGLAIVALLGGCAQERVGMTVPFTGTWHQLRSSSLASQGIDSTEEIGFLGLGTATVVLNLSGLPRATLPISNQQTEPGLRSGSIVCGDDLVLYLAVGQGLAEYQAGGARMLSQTTWLDVHCFRRVAGKQDEHPLMTVRLWADEAVAAADLARRQRLAAPVTPATSASEAVAATPTATPMRAEDRRFSQQVGGTSDGFLSVATQELIRARHADESIIGFYRRISLTARSAVLDQLYTAHQGDANALAEADRQTANLASFDQAFGEWSRIRH